MDFFKNFFGGKPLSKDVAKDRLRLILVSDRANCSTELLEKMRKDIMEVIMRYVDIDDNDGLDINISTIVSEQNETVPVLTANIPIKNMRNYRP